MVNPKAQVTVFTIHNAGGTPAYATMVATFKAEGFDPMSTVALTIEGNTIDPAVFKTGIRAVADSNGVATIANDGFAFPASMLGQSINFIVSTYNPPTPQAAKVVKIPAKLPVVPAGGDVGSFASPVLSVAGPPALSLGNIDLSDPLTQGVLIALGVAGGVGIAVAAYASTPEGKRQFSRAARFA